MRQYANSPIIQALVEDIRDYYDAEGLTKRFYDKIWNLDTASTYGLDIWGRIVDIGRYLTIDGELDVIGFDTADLAWNPFNQAPFVPEEVSTQTYRLEDNAYRKLILAKAMSNIFGRSAQGLNNMLTLLFEGRGKAYALDLGGMRMRYVFEFELEPYERAIVHNEKIFARPAGVESEAKELPSYLFGFAPDAQPFNQGMFWQGAE